MAAAASPLTTHVLDTSRGTPARNVQIQLFRLTLDSSSGDLGIIGSWDLLKEGKTNDDGRFPNLLEKKEFSSGVYKMVFHTRSYYQQLNQSTFYPFVEVVFEIVNIEEHYHVPLLISPYGFSTYRGKPFGRNQVRLYGIGILATNRTRLPNNGMDGSYSSSFESDDDNEATQNQGKGKPKFSTGESRNKPITSRGLDLGLLDQTVRNLQDTSLDSPIDPTQIDGAISDTTRTNGKRATASNHKEIKNFDADSKEVSAEKTEKQKSVMQPVLYFKKQSPCFKGSSTINRRKKLKQIEHDNLILLKKLQAVKPSTEVTNWRKGLRVVSAPSISAPRLTSRTDHPEKSA